MTLEEARAQIPLYLDGELSPGERAQVEALLADSAALRTELERWKQLNNCLRRCCETDCCPGDLGERVRANLAAERRRGGWRTIRIGMPVAVAAMVGLFLWFRPELINSGMRALSPQGTAVAGVTLAPADLERVWHHCGKDGACRHVLPAKSLAAAHEQLHNEFRFDVESPDLSALGFEFRGCCHCFPGNQAPAAHVFYRDPKSERVVSIFSIATPVELKFCKPGPASCKKIKDFQEGRVAGVSVIKWTRGSCSYAMVGDMPLDELRPIALGVARPAP